MMKEMGLPDISPEMLKQMPIDQLLADCDKNKKKNKTKISKK